MLSQVQQLRELDQEGKLNLDVIDGILSHGKKKEDRNVIINGAEREKYFGKDKSDGSHFVSSRYLVDNHSGFMALYIGRDDISDEHRVFSIPKLSIRELGGSF